MLPILEHQREILDHLTAGNRLVLTAPTGSGKTTQIPQILHRERNARVAVLQPRRLATRLVAQRVAQEMGTELGELALGRNVLVAFMPATTARSPPIPASASLPRGSFCDGCNPTRNSTNSTS